MEKSGKLGAIQLTRVASVACAFPRLGISVGTVGTPGTTESSLSHVFRLGITDVCATCEFLSSSKTSTKALGKMYTTRCCSPLIRILYKFRSFVFVYSFCAHRSKSVFRSHGNDLPCFS